MMTDTLTPVDMKQEYLTSQLIPYIGNKRRLLPFLREIFSSLTADIDNPVFIDPFAGTGSVSRLAKVMGMTVRANDWEPYTEVLNGCYLSLGNKDLESLFSDRGGVDAVIRTLNNDTGAYVPYISRHYAPENLEKADYRKERLFYTPQNAVFIDRLRARIDEWYPRRSPERTVLLAALILQAAVRTNTSGVFKAFHKGFGGHGKDALGRIMTPMQLLRPCLIDGKNPCTVFRMDAAAFAYGRPADLCYLDPPYNMHQYGSNYHLLNTITLWDMPEVNDDLGSDGRLLEKAGIRKDWIGTRSSFCSYKTAPDSLKNLLDAVDARYIVMSYNTEGIIPFEELYEILSSRGATEVKTRDYTTYRGGRQSINRKVANLEFQLICRTDRPGVAGSRRKVREFMVRQRVYMLLKEPFVPERLACMFKTSGSLVAFRPGLELPAVRLYRFVDTPCFETLEAIPQAEIEDLYRRLSEAVCKDREEESRVLLDLLRQDLSEKERRYIQERFLSAIRKFAHKKYKIRFEEILREVRTAARQDPAGFRGLERPLDKIAILAERRFRG